VAVPASHLVEPRFQSFAAIVFRNSSLGKGRKHRSTPLRRDAVVALAAWLRTQSGSPTDPLFPTIRGHSLSRDAVERLVARYASAAAERCPSLKGKRVTPHVLRHGTAMELLHHGVDRAVIALWLGHESVETTQMYLHADLRLKEMALAWHSDRPLSRPPDGEPSRQAARHR
jgi:integrase/recombinase XerD